MAVDHKGGQPMVDGTDWLVWTYPPAEWRAYATRELRRTPQGAAVKMGLAWLWAALLGGLLGLGYISRSGSLLGLIGSGLGFGLLPGLMFTSEWASESRAARQWYQGRMQAPTGTIRLAARQMCDPGGVTGFVTPAGGPLPRNSRPAPRPICGLCCGSGRGAIPGLLPCTSPFPPGTKPKRRRLCSALRPKWSHPAGTSSTGSGNSPQRYGRRPQRSRSAARPRPAARVLGRQGRRPASARGDCPPIRERPGPRRPARATGRGTRPARAPRIIPPSACRPPLRGAARP